MTTQFGPQHLLQDVLSRNPRASLAEIRTFHPIFRCMSVDQLSVRLAQAIDGWAGLRGK